MHHLSPLLPKEKPHFQRMSRPGKFFALLRIKPHAPPLVRPPSIPFEFQPAAVLPSGVHALTSAPAAETSTLSTHRLRRTTRYLILLLSRCAPQHTEKSPSPLVFLHIPTHFTATHGIPLSSSAQVSQFPRPSTVEPPHQT